MGVKMDFEKELVSADYFIIPKNSGLEKCRNIAKTYSINKNIEVRGEDVPLIVSRFIKEGKRAIGITGEDLFKEFLIETRDPPIMLAKRIPWEDERCIFGKPALCLLGPKGKTLSDLPKELKIGINSKYKELSKRECINLLENKGYKVEKIYASGSTEELFVNGIVDLIVDIVYSGKSAEKANLAVYDKIFESDIVIICEKEKPKIEEKKITDKRFTLNDLYNKIKIRISSTNKYSYTLKLVNNPQLLKRKLVEEAAEVITAKDRENLIWECSDLIYFLFVIMAQEGVTISDVEKENQRRNKE
jgi:phosphoribosyl-ATP pyrophosphohydrolase